MRGRQPDDQDRRRAKPISRWLGFLEKWVAREQREFLIGDLVESFHHRRQERGRWRARWWLLREVVGLLRHGWIQPTHLPKLKEGVMVQPVQLASEWSQNLLRDLRIAVRRWQKAPTSALVVIATLTLGIGFNALVFMLADLVLFRPAVFEQPDRLISIQTNVGGRGWYGASEPELVDFESLEVLQSVAAWTADRVPLESSSGDRRIQVARVTEHMLPLLGTQPVLGRFPDAEEGLPGAEPVVVISHGLWRQELGGRRDVLGKMLHLQGRATEIIGVMPAGFDFPISQVQAWLPLPFDRNDLWGRTNHYLNVIARLADGTSVAQAETAISVLASQSAAAYPEIYSQNGYRTLTQKLRQAQTANERAPMLMLLGSVVLLLLLTCANVANIQLGRGAARGREIALRRALGASNDRLIAEQMADAFVIASAGAVCALGLAWAGARWMPLFLPESLLRFGEPRLDLRVLAFTLVVTLLTTLAFGLWPAIRSLIGLQAGGESPTSTARHSGQSRGLRSALVVGQMMLACVLLIGCGMTVRSLFNLIDVDPGFSPEGVLVVDAAPAESSMATEQEVVEYYRAVEQALVGLPGVSAAGSMARLPMTGSGNIWSIEIEGRPVANIGEAPAAQVQQATPGVFKTLGMDLLRGRIFDRQDTAQSEPVVVVNESFAREFWRGEEAIGKRFRVFSEGAPFMRVVGVVADLRDGRLDQEGRSQWYVPHAQAFQTAYVSPREMRIVVKTALQAPTDMAPAVLDRLREVNPAVLLVDPISLPATVAHSLSLPRQMALWLGIFAAVALLLAALGLYGALSFLVTVRRGEIGIRLAVGATPGQILARVVGEGLGLCLLGLALGLGLGLALSNLAADLFFEVHGVDPGVMLSTLLILMAVGVPAALAPALKAGRTDPCVTLRRD